MHHRLTNIPISLYIHMPWCVKKCPYCDFNSHASKGVLPQQEYIDQLRHEWDLCLKFCAGRPLHSIFIGGGTPSLIDPKLIGQLLSHIKASISYLPDIEITMEANPGTVDNQHLLQLPEIGINRLSLGAQSFNQKHLAMLGRIHDEEAIYLAFNNARAAGLQNINLDIMHGLPGQNTKQALADLQQAIALKPEHISWYQLTIEPNTFFARRPPPLPHDDAIAQIQQAGQTLLRHAGYDQYEVSAYAKDALMSQHNLNYWLFGDYIGIGAGAHSKITAPCGTIYRQWNRKHPKRYLAATLNQPESNHIRQQPLPSDYEPGCLHKNKLAEHKQLTMEDQLIEFMLCALRLNRPIPTELLTERTTIECDNPALTTKMNKAEKLGLILYDNNHIVTTNKGKRYLNELLEIFL